MIFKILTIIVVLFLVYIVFFKKNREDVISKNAKKAAKKASEKNEDILEECPKCSTFIAKDEAILHNGKYFCSNECLK